MYLLYALGKLCFLLQHMAEFMIQW